MDKAVRKTVMLMLKLILGKLFIHNHKDGILEYIFKSNKEEYIFEI